METVGQHLQAARIKKGLSIAEVASVTRIMTQQIQGLENDNFSSIPAPMYGKGFIKLYAQLLDLEPQPLIDLYLQQIGQNPAAPKSRVAPPVVSVLDTAPTARAEAGDEDAADVDGSVDADSVVVERRAADRPVLSARTNRQGPGVLTRLRGRLSAHRRAVVLGLVAFVVVLGGLRIWALTRTDDGEVPFAPLPAAKPGLVEQAMVPYLDLPESEAL